MDKLTIVGNIAAVLVTISFLPQAIKTIRTRDTKSLSLPTYILFVLGVVLWTYYGYLSEVLSIFLGNAITLVFSGIILFCKLFEKSEDEKQ